jgi:hypothetical protein
MQLNKLIRKYFSKKKNRIFIYFGILLVVILAGTIGGVLWLKPSLRSLVPSPGGNLYIEKISSNERVQQLKVSLEAEDAISVMYKINGLNNSNAILEILKYSETTYGKWISLHLSSETIKIGSKETTIPCKNISIFNVSIKSCIYSAGKINVVKDTFSLEKKFVIRILCSEGSKESAENHCAQIAKGVIEKVN